MPANAWLNSTFVTTQKRTRGLWQIHFFRSFSASHPLQDLALHTAHLAENMSFLGFSTLSLGHEDGTVGSPQRIGVVQQQVQQQQQQHQQHPQLPSRTLTKLSAQDEVQKISQQYQEEGKQGFLLATARQLWHSGCADRSYGLPQLPAWLNS